ncbi:hypothetical protein [Streptomyces paludis]|uniref:HEAT repeat domain-containing protein n=1 Tax=Streptomyces paludis TaxID=2282738 RepID=A0A345HWK4_9ACTN|nr:hypothetical protein [Streptomyces paludis]AXG81078.1 hypothetical protein DVK44_29150 [Streptomyces paludis]
MDLTQSDRQSLARVLEDLDDHPWSELEHAYGEADDVPDLLRAAAGEDEEEAEEALGELYGSILHQGSVYSASACAVPYLAGLAAAGVRTAELIVFVGGIAEGDGVYDGTPPGDCQAAAVAQLPLILPLIESDDPEVRQAAAWAAACTGAAGAVFPALAGRWPREKEPLVRAELLAGLVRLADADEAAAETARTLATASLDGEEPAELRIAAALGCLDLGLPWTGAHHDTVLAVLPADRLVAGRLDMERREPLQCVTDALLRRDTPADREAALALLDAALRMTDTETRAEALWAAEQACLISRAAPARLADAVIALLADRASARSALGVLDKLGPLAGPAVPELVALTSHEGVLADLALKALTGLAPAQAAPLLARDLGERPHALGAAAGSPGGRTSAPAPPPFDEDLLAAVRARLTTPDLDGNEPIHLALLLTPWGERAAAAAPELAPYLDRFALSVAPALAALSPVWAVGPLTGTAVDGPEEARLPAARALFGLTGAPGPLLAAITAGLASGDTYRVRQAAEATEALGRAGGESAAVPLPRLRAALGTAEDRTTHPRMEADLAISLALHRLTGDPAEALPVIASVLERVDDEWIRWPAVHAARAAALLGPAAASLRPLLARGLSRPDLAPAMALALLATTPPEDGHHPGLADALLTSAETDADPMGALEALTALGADALTPAELHRLTALATRDRRVLITASEPRPAHADTRFRETARALLRTRTA